MASAVTYKEFVRDFVVGDRRISDRHDLYIRTARDRTINGPSNGPFQFSVVNPHSGIVSSLKSFPVATFDEATRVYAADEDVLQVLSFRPLGEDDKNRLLLLASLVSFVAPSVSRIVPPWIIWRVALPLRQIRESLGLTQDDVAHNLGTSRIAVSRWEAGSQFPSRPRLYEWCRVLGLICPPKTALVRVIDFSPDLLRFLQEDPTRLRTLTPNQFERFVAERLDRMGYNVTLTGATNRKDGGIDLIAAPKLAALGSVVVAGQVKHHCRDDRTGRDAVDRLLAWKDSYFGVGLLVTNTGFTRDAVWTAQQERNVRFLRLRDFNDLKRWLEGQFGSKEDWREIPDRVELAPGMVIEIPRPRITCQSKTTVQWQNP